MPPVGLTDLRAMWRHSWHARLQAQHGLGVIEDRAEAKGAHRQGCPVASTTRATAKASER